MRFHRNKKLNLVLMVAIITLLLVVVVVGCTTGNPAKGWAGVAIDNGKLFIGSLSGKVVGMEEDTGNRLFNDLSLETGTSGGFLGCGAAQVSVAMYGTPVVSGEWAYVAGYNGKIYPVDINKGIKGQAFQPERGLQPIIGGLAIAQDTLFFGTASGYVYSIDITTRTQNWEFKAGNKIWATPLVNDNTLYIGSFDKTLYALNIADGKEKWQFKTDGAIVSTPVVANNTVYFGTLDRYFYAVDATSGNLKWKSSEIAEKWYWANPLIVNNVIYAPNMDGRVYVFNADNGQNIIEPIVIGSPVSSSPVIVGDKIILGAQDGRVWTIDTGNNTLKQLGDKSLGKIYASLSADGNVVFIHTQASVLHAVNAETGVVLWSKSLTSN